jgi:tetratricopeptide (TPR) repeat protein
MFQARTPRAKFNSACGWISDRMPNLPMRSIGISHLVTALATAFCLLDSSTVTGAAGQQGVKVTPQAHHGTDSRCPAQDAVNAALVNASASMEQARYSDAAQTLSPLSPLDCDARVSLLLAAALEASGDLPGAEQTLEHAHSIWLANTSIATSLAREYFGARDVGKAAQALAHFHATATTPLQEMDLAVIVYFSAHQLVSAQAVAEMAYKTYPSIHTLLLLANALQLQGRYPDVDRLLGDKRATYADSPEFLITLAESESDASIFPAARKDLERAISLNPKSYQAHYLLGYVLARVHDVDRAIGEYHIAIELDPGQPRTYYQLALALETKQDQAGEEHALEQALAADDHYAPAHCEIGKILIDENRLADAVSHLTAAIQYNPSSEEAYYLLVRAYAGLGEKDKSNAMVKRLIAVRKANRPGAENKVSSHPAADLATNP